MGNNYQKNKYKRDNPSISYEVRDWRNNMYFLKHLIDCINGNKDEETVTHTIDQLKCMIRELSKKEKKDIKNSHSSMGSL